jgi:hypothetical protein
MARIGRFDRIHGQGPDGIRHVLVADLLLFGAQDLTFRQNFLLENA